MAAGKIFAAACLFFLIRNHFSANLFRGGTGLPTLWGNMSDTHFQCIQQVRGIDTVLAFERFGENQAAGACIGQRFMVVQDNIEIIANSIQLMVFHLWPQQLRDLNRADIIKGGNRNSIILQQAAQNDGIKRSVVTDDQLTINAVPNLFPDLVKGRCILHHSCLDSVNTDVVPVEFSIFLRRADERIGLTNGNAILEFDNTDGTCAEHGCICCFKIDCSEFHKWSSND